MGLSSAPHNRFGCHPVAGKDLIKQQLINTNKIINCKQNYYVMLLIIQVISHIL